MANIENDHDYWVLLLLSQNDKRFGEFLKYVNRVSLVNKICRLIKNGFVVKLIPNVNKPHITLYRITESGRFLLQAKVKERILEIEDELELLHTVKVFEIY